ncbi:unnamed protein product [Prorocentrum cordatum]|nr:unnamed protein product [Polarella glacialis]
MWHTLFWRRAAWVHVVRQAFEFVRTLLAGGLDVVKATNWREVESAVQHMIFSREYGLAVSPYKRIIDEFRCICLDGSVELVYRKLRASVAGDGESSVAVLVARAAAAADPAAAVGFLQAAAEMKPEELTSVPKSGETVALQWKHNLGQGARADLGVAPDVAERLRCVAVKTTAAIGMRFCSVDIIDVESEGLMVMEAAGGVAEGSWEKPRPRGGGGAADEAAVLRALGR